MTKIHGDTHLRARVKLFGNVLGNVLRPLQDGRVLEAVEALRKGYIRLHKKDSPSGRRRLEKIIESLDAETLTHVVRAFSIYFSLVNLAEESFQHQTRRAQVYHGGPLWKGSFDATLREFHDQGITAADDVIGFNRPPLPGLDGDLVGTPPASGTDSTARRLRPAHGPERTKEIVC